MKPIKALILAAGHGTRLLPLTKSWPKPLMPIHTRPLLEYWICLLGNLSIQNILVNIHDHKEIMEVFLNRPQLIKKVRSVYESKCLGTGGTLYSNRKFFRNCTTLFIHADNWCQCDFHDFINYHQNLRPKNALMTMMTFRTSTPKDCGVVELDKNGIVQKFYEKVKNPPGNLANGSIYLLEPAVLSMLEDMPNVYDFDIDVIPKLLGKISTWENTKILRDIGNLESLLIAQKDPLPNIDMLKLDSWQLKFENNSINDKLKALLQIKDINNLNTNFI